MAYSSGVAAASSATQPKRPSFTTQLYGPAPMASLLVDKSKAHIRRSTPDSEALASSDDEQEFSHRTAHHQPPHSNRRPSWMLETNSNRKASHGASEAVSPGAWDLGLTGVSGGNAAYNAWGGASIWNDNSVPRSAQSRLQDLSKEHKALDSSSGHDSTHGVIGRRGSNVQPAIPFPIPENANMKLYRSQSYSVGQSDQSPIKEASHAMQSSYASRIRNVSGTPGAQHRPARPSNLGSDFSPENSTFLEQVREVADDDETSVISSDSGVRLPAGYHKKMDHVAAGNLIRQQLQHGLSMGSTDRAGSFSHPGASRPYLGGGNRPLYVQESVLEETDDIDHGASNVASQIADSFSAMTIESRELANVKNGHWSSSLGFDRQPQPAESRRHSFADHMVREQPRSAGTGLQALSAAAQSFNYGQISTRHPGDNTRYFEPNVNQRTNDYFRPPSSGSGAHQGHRGMTQSPALNMHDYLLALGPVFYIVTFKAARAEIYMVPSETGLEVNVGDLVIVEADRGTDLGTVQRKHIDWTIALELKEKYSEDHYNWLMMFSRHKVDGPSPPGTSAGRHGGGSAIGGMRSGPSHQQSEKADKPKYIKRLAQGHEIQHLRDKEAQEAKAKRTCQQKVVEHHLNMEILDAEFQMDWKKLTFYYYADSYVNFNNLVTDLFKGFKTRIWMSAINPDSFVSAAPSGMPHGRGRDRFGDTRPTADGNGMGYGAIPDMHGGYNQWPTQEYMAQQMGPSSAYGHFFNHQAATQPYGSTVVMQQDFGHRMYGLNNGTRNHPSLDGLQNGQASAADYAEQLRTFQNLSQGNGR